MDGKGKREAPVAAEEASRAKRRRKDDGEEGLAPTSVSVKKKTMGEAASDGDLERVKQLV